MNMTNERFFIQEKLLSSYPCYSFIQIFFFPENNFKYTGSVTVSIIVFVMSLAIKIDIRIAGEGEYNPLPT